MNEEKYIKLAHVLNTLPNGFPATDSGVEIRLLKRIFRPEDAELFCELRLDFETPEQISARTGRPLEGLEDQLIEMSKRGQVFRIDFGEVKTFKMLPWAFGIYEFQLHHMDRELAEMCEEFMGAFGKQFIKHKPQLMQVLPIEKKIPGRHESLPHEQVSNIIENSQSFAVFDCICKKQKRLLDKGCEKPLEVCTAYAPVPGFFENLEHYRAISKTDAYAVLAKAEEAALVHLTWNVSNGNFFICNCCGCCCEVLSMINKLGAKASDVINSNYFAQINPDECTACGICKEERCQVHAIEEEDSVYMVNHEKCIGCGLCVTHCPTGAITLKRKNAEEVTLPPKDEMDWYRQRASDRAVDIQRFV